MGKQRRAYLPMLVSTDSLDTLTGQIERLQSDLDKSRRYANGKDNEAYIYRRALELLMRTDDLPAAAGEVIRQALEDRGRSLG